MKHVHWSPKDRAEYDDLLRQVITDEERTSERTALMLRLVEDAVQAQRPWARDVQVEALAIGHAAQFKSFLKRDRALVNYRGELVAKPRVIGVSRKGDDGSTYVVQEMFSALPFQELREKRREYLGNIHSYSGLVALADRLLALEEMSPESETPEDACRALGIDLDDYLATAA